jgi:hypothetical protein
LPTAVFKAAFSETFAIQCLQVNYISRGDRIMTLKNETVYFRIGRLDETDLSDLKSVYKNLVETGSHEPELNSHLSVELVKTGLKVSGPKFIYCFRHCTIHRNKSSIMMAYSESGFAQCLVLIVGTDNCQLLPSSF